MKKSFALRAICTLLILTLSLSLFSCNEKKDEDYIPDQNLEIIQEPIQYTDEFIENANLRFTNIGISFVESYYGTEPNEKQTQNISTEFKKTVIPMLYRIRIYEEECDAILSELEEYTENQDGEGKNPLLSIYECCLYTVGSDRSGMIAYETAQIILTRREADAREKYEEHGYSWHKDDMDRCATIKKDLVEMGEKKFISAISMFSFLTSLSVEAGENEEENSFTLSDKEFLEILDKQGECFKDEGLTDENFRVFASLISEFIPERSADFDEAVLYAIKKDGYLISISPAMTKIVNLYASLSHRLNSQGKLSLEGEEWENTLAIISALLECEAELRELTTATESVGVYSSTRIDDVVKEHGKAEEYESFISSHPAIDADMLITRLEEIGQAGSQDAPDRLKFEIASYLSGIAPQIAFAYLGQ